MSDNKKKGNIRALKSFRVGGAPIQVGQVISKREFSKTGDWQNLCHMSPPKAEETNDPVGDGKPKTKGKGKTEGKLPGGTT